MVIDLEELKRLAEAATPGEWKYSADEQGTTLHGWPTTQHERVYGPTPSITAAKNGEHFTKDMRFIAAANPAAVLALIARVEELEKCAADVKAEFDRGEWVTGAGYREQVARAERAESERDAYKEHSELLEGWSKATTKALTGEESPELRMAWTCEAVREMRAQNEALKTFARNFAETVADDFAKEEAHNPGGMHVPLTGDFVRLPPSAKSRLRWWAERAKEALKEGK